MSQALVKEKKAKPSSGGSKSNERRGRPSKFLECASDAALQSVSDATTEGDIPVGVVANIFGVAKQTVLGWRDTGHLPDTHTVDGLGRKLFFKAKDIEVAIRKAINTRTRIEKAKD